MDFKYRIMATILFCYQGCSAKNGRRKSLAKVIMGRNNGAGELDGLMEFQPFDRIKSEQFESQCSRQ